MKKAAKAVEEILDLVEAKREELEGSAVMDEIETAIAVIAEKYNLKLR